MKTKLLILSILTGVFIFVFSGASWADQRKIRNGHHGRDKHYKSDKYQRQLHYRHGWKKHNRHYYKKHRYYRHRHKYHRPYYRNHYYYRPYKRHDYYYRRPHHRHHYRDHHYGHGYSHSGFSIGTFIYEPGFAFSITTKKRY